MRSNLGLRPIPFSLERQHKSTEMQIGEFAFQILQSKGQELSKATALSSGFPKSHFCHLIAFFQEFFIFFI